VHTVNTYEARLEKAARILCGMRNQNPDEILADPVFPDHFGGPVRNMRPRWHDARTELEAHRQRDEAFEFVRQAASEEMRHAR
jgi:hypothetical protein